MHKIFPHLDHGKPLRPKPEPQASSVPKGTVATPPPLPFSAVAYGRWQRWMRQQNSFRRRVHAQLISTTLKVELLTRHSKEKALARITGIAATLFSAVVAVVFMAFADGADIKASETHLAAAQIIGAALALVLSLSIIPAQRAAELFSIVVLKLLAKDRALLSVFLILVATTILSLLLGTRWLASLDPKTSLCIQFLLIGLSFDALRRFYVSTLELLAPESAIRRIVKESLALSRSIGLLADKTVAIQVAATGATSPADRIVYARSIVSSRLPVHLQNASSQLQEFAHRFIARRDSNATIETLNALETLATDYAELRRKGLTLHIDPQFVFAGPQSDISDVLSPTCESIHHIIEDAISSKNERIVRHAVGVLGRMTLHAMGMVTEREHGDKFAPLAFIAAFYFDRSVRTVLAANMPDAVLHAITVLETILRNRRLDTDTGGLSEKVNETLFAIAVDGYVKSNGLNVFRSVEAILRSLALDIESENLDTTTLESILQRLLQLVPAEIAADASGQRSLQTFPAYNLGFEASIPMLVQMVAMKAKLDPDRKWEDPFSELSDVAEIVRDHYRHLSGLDFKGVLLRKWVVDSLDAILRVLFHEVSSPSGAEAFVETVADDLKPLITWVSAFFKSENVHKQHHLSDATSQLAILGINALDVSRPDIAETCADTLKSIANNLAGHISAYELADIHMDIEAIARAGDAIGSTAFSARVRAMVILPVHFDKEQHQRHIEARLTRLGQLDDALSRAGRRSSGIRNSPVERLFAFQRKRRKVAPHA
ncbi:hypothetical protein PMN64_09660 [Bradyrhizobium sp. UFLA01-814]|uniref:hypothetical protein n=1 Tax=Bradyrhizobium sp. UFLA01-814 TaxID=3023480 RepID=UPI00398AF1BE